MSLLARWMTVTAPHSPSGMDLAHARQIAPTMTEAYLILREFGNRLVEVHISEANSAGVALSPRPMRHAMTESNDVRISIGVFG